MSPKRMQSSPGVLPGDKCSPKKVKLGLQPPLTMAPASSTRGKTHPLTSHHPNIPFTSVPKVPGKKGSPRASPPQEGGLRTSPGKESLPGRQLPKKRAEKTAPSCSECPSGAQATLGLGDSVPGKLPSKSRKVQPVRPVQKQLVSRGELTFGQSQHVAKDGGHAGTRSACGS